VESVLEGVVDVVCRHLDIETHAVLGKLFQLRLHKGWDDGGEARALPKSFLTLVAARLLRHRRRPGSG
jgi:hypothetical protein